MSLSSTRWCQRQAKDPYVQQAKAQGWRSRACFKLLELHQKDKLFKQGMSILDLGCAPGSWCQVLHSITHGKARLWAVDLLEMASLPNVTFIQGDFTSETLLTKLTSSLAQEKLDWIISDMAPNLTGVRAVDQARSMYLLELVVDFAKDFLKPGGGVLLKAFHGVGLESFVKELRTVFKSVAFRKPKASRSESAEIYILARGWRKV